MLRKGAVNIIDVRWVLKWKWVKLDKADNYSSFDSFWKKGELVRVIRARLTVRGFKDAGKGSVPN